MTIDQLVTLLQKYQRIGGNILVTCDIKSEKSDPEDIEVETRAPLVVGGILPGFVSINLVEKPYDKRKR